TLGVNDRIQFAVNGNITLVSDLPAVTKKLTIEGPGADTLTIDGDFQYRALNVTGTGNADVSGLQFAFCHSGDSGGVARNDGKLSLYHVIVHEGNTEKHGGIVENNGTLIIDECDFNSSYASKFGGAIDNNSFATITNSTISNSSAENAGGAIWSNGTLTL